MLLLCVCMPTDSVVRHAIKWLNNIIIHLSHRVHNGVEYGDMQLIGEVYDILKHIVGLDNEEMAKLFVEWNKTELESYLIEITAKILAKKDDLTDDGYVIDKILDKTGMKGTGKFQPNATTITATTRCILIPLYLSAIDSF